MSASTETARWQAVRIHARLWFSFATSPALLATLVHLARLGFPRFIPVIKVVCNVDLLLSLSLLPRQTLNSDSNQCACSCLHPSIWACFSGVPSLAWMSHTFLRSGDSFSSTATASYLLPLSPDFSILPCLLTLPLADSFSPVSEYQ